MPKRRAKKRPHRHPAKEAARREAVALALPEERQRRKHAAYAADYQAMLTEARSMGASPEEIPPFMPRKNRDRHAQLAEHLGLSMRKVREMLKTQQIQTNGARLINRTGDAGRSAR